MFCTIYRSKCEGVFSEALLSDRGLSLYHEYLSFVSMKFPPDLAKYSGCRGLQCI